MKKIFTATKVDFQRLFGRLYSSLDDLKDSFIEFIDNLINVIIHIIAIILAPITRPIRNFLIIKKNKLVKLDNDNLEVLHRIVSSQFKNDTFMQNVTYNYKLDYIVNTIIREHINKSKDN